MLPSAKPLQLCEIALQLRWQPLARLADLKIMVQLLQDLQAEAGSGHILVAEGCFGTGSEPLE